MCEKSELELKFEALRRQTNLSLGFMLLYNITLVIIFIKIGVFESF